MTDRDRICAWLLDHGPATLAEVSRGVALLDHTVSAALTKMVRDGRTERAGSRPGTGPNGRPVTLQLWQAGPAAQSVVTAPAPADNVPLVASALRDRPALERAWMGMQG